MPTEEQTTPTFTRPLSSKDVQSLTIWDMQSAKTGQSLRQVVWCMSAALIAAAIGSFVFWWQRAIQKHGAITQRDIDKWPLLVTAYLVIVIIVVYLFFRNVLPTARRDLAKLQEQARAEDTHSSTTSPRC